MAPHELYIWSSKLLQIPLSYFFWYTHTNLELVGTHRSCRPTGGPRQKKRHIIIPEPHPGVSFRAYARDRIGVCAKEICVNVPYTSIIRDTLYHSMCMLKIPLGSILILGTNYMNIHF